MPETIDHDTWNYSLPKTPRAPQIDLGDIHGTLPFDGVRNPSSRSSMSQKVIFGYRTRASGIKRKVGMAESAVEAAVALEALMAETTYDLEFQPLKVFYTGDDGRKVPYTHDLRITSNTGHRRMVFVRHDHSLSKPSTEREIAAIVKATPRSEANDLVVANAVDYPRQRRDNLFRMHRFVLEPDPEADEIVWEVAQRRRPYLMRDLFPVAPIQQRRVFAACHRLVARKRMQANLNHVLWEHSRLELAA
ncbi:hypothetical protein V8J36_03435 [Frigidibacter sp. MR17.14]|uniref:hypothetical protein n=1 Tax=Frigidibacter sp. MR17.14 TaxID=3126509 RepID=UPI0030131893